MRVIKIYAKNLKEIKNILENILDIKNVELKGDYMVFELHALNKLPAIFQIASEYNATVIIALASDRDVSKEIKEGIKNIGQIL